MNMLAFLLDHIGCDDKIAKVREEKAVAYVALNECHARMDKCDEFLDKLGYRDAGEDTAEQIARDIRALATLLGTPVPSVSLELPLVGTLRNIRADLAARVTATEETEARYAALQSELP